MTFEHRHESKSCSACQERVNESVKVFLVPIFGLTIMEIGDWRFASLLFYLVYFSRSLDIGDSVTLLLLQTLQVFSN